MKTTRPKTYNKTSKKAFIDFEKETKEIRIIQDLARKEQLIKISAVVPTSEMNYYKI